eukprot:TRINITY_DN2662_c0_g1_i1.p1 TRINITY_DN2662_c0_g1~~TRINITY_DN2662_c0_g1_i1.p1  ORF type:complete len:1638 (-),score=198.24 TRINITY_DN2662_c0_g1_i1:1834-6747(-)
MTFSPPPWSEVAHLLLFGCYFYFAFFLLAATFSYSYAIPMYIQPTLDYVFNSLDARLQQTWLKEKIEGTFLNRISRGFAFGVIRMLVSTIICIMYVYSTYTGYISPLLFICQKCVAVVLFLNIFAKLVYATRPVSFVLGFEAIMDIFSLASLLMAKRTHWLNFSFLQAYVILSRYFQIEPTLEIYFMVKSSPFHRQLTRLALEFVVFIYVFASGLQLFEQLGEPWEPLIGTTFDLTLANSFYFTVVTIFTVGYGDFVPFTLLGRLWIIFIIVFGAYLVSRKIGQVVDVVSSLRRGLGSFVKTEGTDHCVICGNVKWEYLKAFVLEFYGDDRNAKTKLVIICDQPNWSETVWINFFTSNIQYRDNVTYLEGSCVTRDDLIRAQVETSKAVFILNNQHNPDPYAEDSETLKRILTIRSYTPNLPIYSMCALRDSMLQITFALEQVDEHDEAEEVTPRRISGMNLRSQTDPSSSDMAAFSSLADELNPHMGDFEDEDDDDDGLLVTSYDGSSDLKSEALCMQEIEMSLLAKNVFCNGLSTLLANLILRVTPMLKDEDPMWAWEYKLGTECRFEYVKLPMQLTNRKFAEIAIIMYDYGVIPVATKRFMDKKWRAVTPETNINLNSIALIITFHSTEYLDTVMAGIASCVTESDSDTASVRSEIPFLDENDPIPRNNRCERAGAILTGDLTVEYQYVDDSDNEDGLETQELSSTHSGEGEEPSSFRREERDESLAPPIPESLGTVPRTPPSEAGLSLETHSSARKSRKTIPPTSNSEAHQVSDPIPVLVNPISQGRRVARSGSIPEQMKSQDKLPLVITRTGSAQHLSSMSGGSSNADGVLSESVQRGIPQQQSESSVAHSDRVTKSSGFQTFVSSPETAGSSQDHRSRKLSDLKSGVQINLEARSAPFAASPSSDRQSLPVEQEPVEEDVRTAPTSRQKRYHVSFENQGHGNVRKSRKGQLTKARKQSGKHQNEESVIMFHGDQELPMKLTGHIVVCTIGRMALQNLGYFLQQVNIERSFSKGKAPVVAICSRLSEEEEADLKLYASSTGVRELDKRRSTTERSLNNSAESEPHQPSLVVIQGNSLSVKTLRRAQFEKAKAVVILACEDVNDIDHMDAKAIFTVMTLDYLLGEDSETFVCTMLDAEESMQLLRAPARPRRRGAVLGRTPEENVELAVTTSPVEKGRRRHSSKNRLGRFNSSFKNSGDSTQQFPVRTLSYGAITASGRVSRSVSFMGDRNFAPGAGGYRNFAHGLSQNSFSQREPSITSFGALQRVRDGDDGALIQNPSLAGDSAFRILLGPSANNGLASTDTLRDEKGRRRAMNGLRHGFRDESFEKQRYASGEMVISSTYMSLLIREFAMPGLIAVVRKIFGATIGKHTKARRSWIRTVSIPAKWIGEGQRTYREVFEVLIGYGAIALGLYRSGNANVRVQFVAGSDYNSSSLYSSRTPSFGSLPGPNIEGSSDGSLGTDFEFHRGELSADIADAHVDVPGLGVEGKNGGNERSGLLESRIGQRNSGYGATVTQDRYGVDTTSGNSESLSGEGRDIEDGIHIPPELYRIAESVVSGQAVSPAWSSNNYGNEVHHKYTCPSSRRTTMYRELPGGDNVLPYVYTNPEAFTLVSDRDAVYVLVSPNVQLPDEW